MQGVIGRNVNRLRLCLLSSFLAIAAVSSAGEPEIDGVFGFEEAAVSLAIAVWVPLDEGEFVEGMSWYNNDAGSVFPAIKAMAGIVERPDNLVNALVVGENVAGQSSSWSNFEFDQPIASTSDGVYILFEVPIGGALIAEGFGGGHGVGYQVGDGLVRCWISAEAGTWDALSPAFQMAVTPIIAANKSSGILVLDRGRPEDRSDTQGPDTVTVPLSNNMIVTPNPFNSTTEIKYVLRQSGHVTLDLFDIRGRLVRRLVNSSISAGAHSAEWNGLDDSGRQLPSGTYLAMMRSGSIRIVDRLTLLK